MAPRRSTRPQPSGRLVVFTLSFRYKNKTADGKLEKKSHPRSIELRTRVKSGEDIEVAVAVAVNRELLRIEMDSPYVIVPNTESYMINSDTPITPKPVNKRNIKMKDATALALDGTPLQTWDTKNNTCVYDFVIWRYKDLPGCKKICNYDALDVIFKSRTKIYYKDGETPWITDLSGNVSFPAGAENITFANDRNGNYYIINDDHRNTNPRVDGVSTHQLNNLCDALGCRSYAFDEQNKLVNNYVPVKDNRKIPPLVYMIKDKHFYAITDKNKSVSQMGKHKTDMEVEKAKVECEVKPLDVVVLEESEKRPSERLVEVMRDVGKQVFPFKNLQVDKKGIRAFTLDNKRYIFEEDESIIPAQKIAELNERPYGGESTFTLLMKMLDELKYTHKSVFNPHTYKIMTSEGVKTRTHYGMTGDMYDVETLQSMIEKNQAICADIAKCYTSVITEPMSEWFQYEFNDHWVGVKKQPETFEPGLYYVYTTDMTLLHSTNIYSHTLLQKAKEKNISFSVVSKYIPTGKSLKKNYFAPLLKRIDEECKSDPLLKKKLTNIITGFLGKHSSERYVARMNTDGEVVWNDFHSDEEFHKNETFMYRVEEFYIYGYIVKQDFAENNIPMYIQILDQSNIRLYNMIEESGGVCAWRKTDCAVIVGGKLDMTTEANAKPGSYRPADFVAKDTLAKTAEERAVELHIRDQGFKVYKEITHSGQTDEVFKILMEEKGLVNLSRAGTGKSYNVLEIEKKFKAQFPDAKIYKLAFTNKACLNIRGTTIHKFLKINRGGKLSLSWLNSLQKHNVLFMIDEVSMIGSFLWRRLVALKRALPDAYFLLCGDFRQVPAVETKYFDYSHCSAIKYMSSYNKIEFIKRQRYDEPLWNFAEKVSVSNDTDYTKVNTKACKDITPEFAVNYTNICYYNATRKRLNQSINEYVAKSKTHKIVLPYTPEDDEEDDDDEVYNTAKDIQQDAILYYGLPIIAHKNKKINKNSIIDDDEKGIEMEMVNNENFVIDECSNTWITATAIRIDDDGNEYNHTITFPTTEFHSRFLLNYCSTTHKSQGATIDNNILIWDYSAMTKNLKYTAITRAKKLSQINIVVSSI